MGYPNTAIVDTSGASKNLNGFIIIFNDFNPKSPRMQAGVPSIDEAPPDTLPVFSPVR